MKKGGLELGSKRNQHTLNQFHMIMTFAKELSLTYVILMHPLSSHQFPLFIYLFI